MKLEDIRKKNIYTVPDKYFDQLPTRIQSRVHEKKPLFGLSLNWNYAYKVVVPAIAMVLIFIIYGINTNNSTLSADEILAQINTDDLITYLEMSDITTDEIIENLDFTDLEIEFPENDPIMQDLEMNDEDIDALLDEYVVNSDFL